MKNIFLITDKKNDWRYKSGNQQPYVEEGQTIQWLKEEGQTIQWPKEEGQTIQWPKEEGQTIQWLKEKAQNNDMHITGQKTKYLWPELISFGQI